MAHPERYIDAAPAVDETQGPSATAGSAATIPFHAVLQNTIDIITVFDRTGRILYQSPAITKVLGRDPVERIGANIFDSKIVHPADRAGKRRFLKRLIAAGPNAELKGEFRTQHVDGSYRYIEAVGINLLHDPVLGGVVLTSRDITMRKTAEAALRTQHELELRTTALMQEQAQLVAVNQAKDEFVSLASHQLRTPATGVKQYVGMLLEGYAGRLTPGQQRLLARAYACNERQLRIIDALLNVARLDAGQVDLRLQRCNLSELLREVTDELQSAAGGQTHVLSLDIGPMPTYVWADSRLLRMAIENIVDNAIKYSRAGLPIDIHVAQTDSMVKIAIRDQGVGIPKKHQAMLFQKFRRIENPLSVTAGGSGLGLYWAKKIIDLHRGDITVASKPHVGSTFTITLPKEAPQ